MYISWSEFLSLFLWRFLLLFGYNYCDWLYVYRCVCWSAVLYFCFCLPLSEYIIGSLQLCHEARSARLVCISAIDNVFFIFLFCVHTSLDFSFFLFICLWMSVPVSSYIKLCLIVSAYTSLLRVSYSLSLWISVLVFGGYIVTHCICTSLDPCFSLYSLWMLLPVFGNIITDCPYIVSSFAVHFYPCFSLFVSLSAYITANSACICTSLYPCFSVLPYR